MAAKATPKLAAPGRSKSVAVAIGVFLIGAVVGADQLSKTLAINRLSDGPAEGPGPFWFRLVANRGGLMGLPLPTWFILAGTVAVLAMALSALAKNAPRQVIAGWGLLVGGAFGNLADRYQHRPRFPDHAVVDWVASVSLPTFNLADVAIVAGLALVMLTSGASPPSRSTPKQEVLA